MIHGTCVAWTSGDPGDLPVLLTDAAWYGGVVLAQVASRASDCLHVLGYGQFALTAAHQAVAAAQDADDPAWIGACRFWYTQAMPPETPRVASRTADRALADLQAHATRPDVRQMLGQLHLSAALRCAVDGRADDARSHLVEATREAASLGDPPDGLGFNGLCFGPTNVSLWRMSVSAELGARQRLPS
jgi:hypothetical protein